MANNNIQDKNFGYELVKTIVHFLYPKFYRQIEVRGLDNVPVDEPLIFAGNHQNGVMDPVAIILFQKEPIVYMARADIFKSPINRMLLRFIKVTPVYRIRDGFENLTKNDQQIKEAINVLLDRKRLGVMPEGNHGENHTLRPLVKGLFRIGYQAEIQLKNRAHVKIIPVGIDYNFYQHAGSDLVLTYGKPIEVKDFLPIYLENPALGLNALRTELSTALSDLMLDIRSENYDRIYRLCCFGVPAYLDFLIEKGIQTEALTVAGLRFDARRALAVLLERLESENPELLETIDKWTMNLNKLPGDPNEISEWMDETPTRTNPILLGFMALILIPGFVLNVPSWMMNRLIVSNVEDKQMHSTFVFTLGIAFNLLVYLSITLFVGNLLKASALQFVMLFLFIGTLGLVSEKGRQFLRIPWRKFKYSFGKQKVLIDACRSDFQKLKEVLKKLLETNGLN